MAEYIDKSKITEATPAEEDNCRGIGMTIDKIKELVIADIIEEFNRYAILTSVESLKRNIGGCRIMALIKDENISKAQNYFLGYMDAKKDMKEKVNKAIDEIRKLSPTPTAEDILDGNPEKDAIWGFLASVLNIIEKNIGGEE